MSGYQVDYDYIPFATHELLEDFIEFMRDNIRENGGFSVQDLNEYFELSTDKADHKDNEQGWVSFSRIKYEFEEDGTGWCHLPAPIIFSVSE